MHSAITVVDNPSSGRPIDADSCTLGPEIRGNIRETKRRYGSTAPVKVYQLCLDCGSLYEQHVWDMEATALTLT